MRPGGWTCAKTPFWSGPCRARQWRTRRSSVRRTRGASSGCRRGSSSKIVTAQLRRAAAAGLLLPQRCWTAGRAGAARGRSVSRRQPRIGVDAVAAGSAQPGLGGGHRRLVLGTQFHVEPHLAIGQMSARHGCSLLGDIPEHPTNAGSATITGREALAGIAAHR